MTSPNNLKWLIKNWEALTKEELYDLLHLRDQVFVVEQGDPYGDVDGQDKKAIHFLAYDQEKLAGYARLFMPGTKRDQEVVLGRICCHTDYRGTGLGKTLLSKRLDYATEHAPEADIFTSLQDYRVPVYEKLGFISISKPYLDGKIMHVDMLKKPF